MTTSKLIQMMGRGIDKFGIVGVDGNVCGGRSAYNMCYKNTVISSRKGKTRWVVTPR